MIPILNTCAISFETLVGIWIFSKIFPKRDCMQKRQIAAELIFWIFFLFVMFHNWGQNIPLVVQLCIGGLCSALLLIFRCRIDRQTPGRLSVSIMRSCLQYLELAIVLGLLAWNGWLGYISTGMVMIGSFPLPLYNYLHHQCNAFSAYVWGFLFGATTQLIHGTYLVYISGTTRKTLGELNTRGGLLTYHTIILTFLVAFFIFALAKYFSLDRILHKYFVRYRFQLLLLASIETLAINYFTDLGNDGITQKDVGRVLIITLLLIFLILVLITGFIKRSLETENQLLDIRNSSIERQYRELNASYNLNRRLIHDEKHRLQFLEECLKNNDFEQAQRVICQYRQTIREQTPRTWTCIPTLDFIINMKKAQMDMQSITFRLDAQLEKLSIREDDFIVLLGNLFDNAIEAAEKCPPDSRFIALRMKQTGEMFLLTMQNASSEPPKTRGSRFLTSKKDSAAHGLGVESIRHIVQKYDGTVTFSYDTSSFQVQIRIAGST